jgi:rfaE bifunctional protein kinase chain/domain
MKLDFSQIKVLVIGDFMIDHYIIGTSHRVSPEAPVPVVIPQKEYSIPGGAGNVAMNLRSIGANVTCHGVVGNDIWGEKLLSLLSKKGINTNGINIIRNHPTTLKKRIYCDGKQVARLDTEVLKEFSNPIHNITDYDVCILSDYNKGVIKNAEFDADLIIVDPKKDDFSVYKNANIVTPNLNELQQATNVEISDDKSIVDACEKLIKEFNFNYIVAKKGDKGITIVGKDKYIKHIQAINVKNPDVTGAGDTVIAVLSVIYAQTNDIELSARIANNAAAIVVGKSGTATVDINDLK